MLDFVPEDHGQATVRAKMFANCSSHFTPERFSARPPLVLPANRQPASVRGTVRMRILHSIRRGPHAVEDVKGRERFARVEVNVERASKQDQPGRSPARTACEGQQ